MNVVFTPLAERHLEQLYDYIASNAGEQRAEAYTGRIIAYCQRLSLFPHRGANRDDLVHGLRTVGFEHRVTVAFVVNADNVVIEGVFYGGRDIDALFRE